jgi:hypothetical protein
MIFFERDDDIGVRGTSRASVGIGEINSAIREPDVVDDTF